MPVAVGEISGHVELDVRAESSNDASCTPTSGVEAEPLKDHPNKSFFCPRVEPVDTVTACCPRLGKYFCIACMCRGRPFVMLGPDCAVTWGCLWPTVLVPTCAFIVFAVPWIATKSPVLAYVSCGAIGWFWLTLFCASCMNPGILLKHNEPESNLANGRRSPRYCTKCKLYQPPNTSHCSECLTCLLYTSPSPRDRQKSRMPSSA